MKHDQSQDLLLEIGTEELPAKKIAALASSLANNLIQNLKELSLTHGAVETYSSPRRLAVLIQNLTTQQPDQNLEFRGPPLSIAFDQLGQPTKAALKFAQSCMVDVAQLEKIEDQKRVILFYKTTKTGKKTSLLLPEVMVNSIKKIPLTKAMHWGNGVGPFVRPVHWLVALFGQETIPIEIFQIKSSNQTRGHRYHHPETITLASPKEYEKLLLQPGYVIAAADKRQKKILEEIHSITKNRSTLLSESLLAEVVNLVEWPVALIGSFNQRFLKLPREVLISTLENQQRYFPIINEKGELLPNFIIISNIKSKHPQEVILGNERVIQARLTDAEYFYHKDLQDDFVKNLEKLQSITFQEKLGTLYEKSLRLESLASFIATKIDANVIHAKQAGKLSKCDLVTSMVWEFPELQGTMGYYYASIKEEEEVAVALKEQYLPRFATDKIPKTNIGAILALADRIDNLIAFFATQKIPSGEKDPFGLRRAAMGVIRIILELHLDLDLKELLNESCLSFKGSWKNSDEIVKQVLAFIYERLRSVYLEQGKNPKIFRALLAVAPTNLQNFTQKFTAIEKFYALPESEDLIAIYKRIRNILDKAKSQNPTKFDLALTVETAESNLAILISQKRAIILALYQNKKYFELLAELIQLKPSLNEFFTKVMVMADEKKLRDNRLALLKELHDLFMLIADLSYLVSGSS